MMQQYAMPTNATRVTQGAVRDPIVEIRGISKTYGAVTALQNIDLSFERGHLTSLLGPSG